MFLSLSLPLISATLKLLSELGHECHKTAVRAGALLSQSCEVTSVSRPHTHSLSGQIWEGRYSPGILNQMEVAGFLIGMLGTWEVKVDQVWQPASV